MKKVSFTTVIYRNFKTQDGKYPVKLRVTYNRKATYLSTGIEVDACDLQLNSSSRNIPLKTTSRANALKYKIQQYVMSFETAAESFDPTLFPEWTTAEVISYLKNIIRKKAEFKLNFVEFCNSFIEEKTRSSSKAAGNYRRAIDLLCKYIGCAEFDISLITSSLMNGWEQHLRREYGDNSRTVSMATSHIATMHGAARKRYNSEEYDEVNIRNPFDYYTPPKQQASKHRALNTEIIQRMINSYNELQGRERLAVGAFLLSLGLMGMNTPDMYECKAPENGVLKYNRHKTRARRQDHAAMEVKVPGCIIPLFEEYKDKTGKRAFNFYRRYSEYSYMEDAEIKGLNKFRARLGKEEESRITFYAARHTWATIARSNRCRISMELIDDCLAHVGSHRIGDIYAQRDWTVLWDANEKVLSTLDWSPLLKR